MRSLFIILPAASALIFAGGCGSVISKNVLKEVDRSVTVDMVQSAPLKLYAGKKVVWGGVILSSENLEKTTEIEVLETALLFDDTPNEMFEKRPSKGRFIVEAPGYLDTAVYKQGNLLTVAAVVKGLSSRKIGKMDYPYPVVTAVEMKLMEPLPKQIHYDTQPWPRRPYPYHPYYYPRPRYYPPPPGYPPYYPYPY